MESLSLKYSVINIKSSSIYQDLIKMFSLDCAGGWASYISEMAQVAIPLIVFKHASIVTDKIDGIANMPSVRDHDSSIAVRVQGGCYSFGGYENNPIFLDQVPRFDCWLERCERYHF